MVKFTNVASDSFKDVVAQLKATKESLSRAEEENTKLQKALAVKIIKEVTQSPEQRQQLVESMVRATTVWEEKEDLKKRFTVLALKNKRLNKKLAASEKKLSELQCWRDRDINWRNIQEFDKIMQGEPLKNYRDGLLYRKEVLELREKLAASEKENIGLKKTVEAVREWCWWGEKVDGWGNKSAYGNEVVYWLFNEG